MDKNVMMLNDETTFGLEQAYRHGWQEWRFRHLKGVEGRVLSAMWASVAGLIRQALSVDKPGIAPARKRLSY